MTTAQRTFFKYWLPVIALCAAIFVQSSFPSPDFGISFAFKDKAMHMAAYGLLAALVYRACRATWTGKLSALQLMLISVCFASIYGVSDELHQSFVPFRRADAMDGVADVAGSMLGALGMMWLTSRAGGTGFRNSAGGCDGSLDDQLPKRK